MNVTVIMKPDCLYCKRFFSYMDELMQTGRYQGVHISFLQDGSEAADYFDYYYLPAVFVGSERMIHGVCKKQDVARVLNQAIALDCPTYK